MIREDVKNGTSNFLHYLYKSRNQWSTDKTKGYSVLDIKTQQKQVFEQTMLEFFNSPDFENNIDFCKFTAYTNPSIAEWNGFIRTNVLDNPDEVIVKDDLLTCYKTIVDDYMKPVTINSEDYAIVSCDKYTRDNNKIEGFKIVLKNLYDDKEVQPLFVVNTANHKARATFLAKHNSLHKAARISKPTMRYRNWTDYFTFKDNHLLVEDILDDSGKPMVSKDFSYGFGLTSHKCQGSTYDNMFIHLQDIVYTKYGSPRKDINLRNRLAYVVFSRARNGAFCLI